MPALNIRQASRSDAPAMHALFCAAIAHHALGWYSPEQIAAWIARRDAASFVRGLDSSVERYFVTEAGGLVTGFSAVKPASCCASGYGELSMLYAAPPVLPLQKVRIGHAPGTGRALLAQAEATLQSLGAESARLVSSLNAQTFYARHGWKTVGPAECGCAGLGVPAMEMVKPLWLSAGK